MFHIKLTARPDARMVEVPLDIDVELPREFDGAAVLVSSGMPRKVRLRSPKDSIKLSTAYRIDQLVADLVRLVLRGQPADVARAQEAAAAFLKISRERRQEGSTFLIESDGRGRVDVHEPPSQQPAFRATGSSGGLNLAPLLERIAALERNLAALEAKVSAPALAEPNDKALRALGEQLERRIDQRLADLEEQLAALNREPLQRPHLRSSEALPTPGARGGMRRATAVEAFAEGLRTELKLRAKQLLQAAQERAALCEKAAQVAIDAERAGAPKLDAGKALQQLASEASARASALGRMVDELELYAAADVPIASQLLDRLARGDAPELLPHLRAITEAAWGAGALQLGWLTRAAQLAGWKVIAPQPGDLFEPSLHELDGPRGDVIDALVMPGVRDKSGSTLLYARVRARGRSDDAARASLDRDLALLAAEPDGARPLSEGSLESAAQPRELVALAQPEGPAEPATPGSDDGIVSAQILDELTSAPIDSAPIISGPVVSGPILSGPILEEITSGPILSAPIPEEREAGPRADAPPASATGSAPRAGEDARAPLVDSNPFASGLLDEPVSAPILEEIVSAPILEEIVEPPIVGMQNKSVPADADGAVAAAELAAELASSHQLAETGTAQALPPSPPPVDEEKWERVGRSASAFKSSEGKQHD